MKLHEYVKPGDTVYTVHLHTSRSGMTHDIAVFTAEWDNISHLLVSELGFSPARNGTGVRVRGCGMDMGYSIVYSMGRGMFPDGVHCVGKRKRCPSNDHTNMPHKPYRSRWRHRDGGYAFRHAWR